jgi:hypothetical protein
MSATAKDAKVAGAAGVTTQGVVPHSATTKPFLQKAEKSKSAAPMQVDLAAKTGGSKCPVLPVVRLPGGVRVCSEKKSTSSKYPAQASNVNDRLRQVLSLPYSDSWDEVSNAIAHNKVDLARGIKFTSKGHLFAPEYFKCISGTVYAKHYAQTPDTSLALRNKWRSAEIFGKIHVMNLVKLMHFTVDHSDKGLWYTSQLIHSLQVYEGVRADKEAITAKHGHDYYVDMLIAALLHDLGKMLTLLGEDDAAADCMNVLLCKPAPASGFDSEDIVQTFNHDEYGYQKLAPYLGHRKNVLAAMRFHSLREAEGSIHAVQGKDLDSRIGYFIEAATPDVAAFVKHFRYYDQYTKRVTGIVPTVDWEQIRELFEAEFPPDGVITW